MGKANKVGAEGETAVAENSELEKRLQEVEIKMAYLEKELEEYKEASRGFYRKLAEAEDEIRKLWKEVPERDMPTPDVTWDSENRDIHP
jgi:uncharacterized coiled-coil protein SlyX